VILMNNILVDLKDNGVDILSVISRFAGNEELCEKFIFKFADDKSLSDAVKSFEKEDYEGVVIGVHTLKGISANLGMTDLNNYCSDIVIKVRNNDYDISEDMDNLKKEYDRIINIINKYR